MKKSLFLLLLLLLAVPARGQAPATRYVAKGGLSTGTCDTAGAACTLARALTQMQPGDRLFFTQATKYVLTETLFASTNCPSEAHPYSLATTCATVRLDAGYIAGTDTFRTIIEGVPGAVLSGLNVRVQGWTQRTAGGNVWRAAWPVEARVPVSASFQGQVETDAMKYREILVDTTTSPVPLQLAESLNLAQEEFYVRDDDVLHGSPDSVFVRLKGNANPNNKVLMTSSLSGIVIDAQDCTGNQAQDKVLLHFKNVIAEYSASYFLTAGLCAGYHAVGDSGPHRERAVGYNLFENVISRYHNGFGAFFTGRGTRASDVYLHHNGPGPAKGKYWHRGRAYRITTRSNNLKGYKHGHERGFKITETDSLWLIDLKSHAELSQALWFDETVRYSWVDRAVIDSAEKAGIMIEYGSVWNLVTNPVITRTRPLAEGSQAGGEAFLVQDTDSNMLAWGTFRDNDGCFRIRYSYPARSRPFTAYTNRVLNTLCLQNRTESQGEVHYENTLARDVSLTNGSDVQALTSAVIAAFESNYGNGNRYWGRGSAAYNYFRFSYPNSDLGGASATVTWAGTPSGFASYQAYSQGEESSALLDTTRADIVSSLNPAVAGWWRLPSTSPVKTGSVALTPPGGVWKFGVPIEMVLRDHDGQARAATGGAVGADEPVEAYTTGNLGAGLGSAVDLGGGRWRVTGRGAGGIFAGRRAGFSVNNALLDGAAFRLRVDSTTTWAGPNARLQGTGIMINEQANPNSAAVILVHYPLSGMVVLWSVARANSRPSVAVAYALVGRGMVHLRVRRSGSTYTASFAKGTTPAPDAYVTLGSVTVPLTAPVARAYAASAHVTNETTGHFSNVGTE